MRLIVFAKSLIKKENITSQEKAVIIKVCQKSIFTKIKGQNMPNNSSLIKIYVTTLNGARRLVLILDEEIDVGYFLFFRKKDDSIGKNISIKNSEFKKALQQYLKLLDKDMDNNNFEIIKLFN